MRTVLENKPIKPAIELSASLFRDLGDYARIHAKANYLADPLPVEKLIPPMVERFIAGDREYGKLRRRE